MENPLTIVPKDVQAISDWIDELPQHHQETLKSRPDVMILAARYGDGHLRAAKAIAMKLMLHETSVKLGILDYYKFVNPALDNLIRWAYLTSVRVFPQAWRWFYTSTQKIASESTTQQWINRIGMEQFYRAIAPSPPKIIISTYPTAAGVVSTLKRMGRLEVANYVVMTDYSVHSQWIHAAVDKYFVGSEDMKQELIGRGVSEDRVEVSGIPIDGRFATPVDVEAVRRKHGLSDDPVILFMGGSYMPIQEFRHILSAIDAIKVPHSTVVVAGRTENRRVTAEHYRASATHPMVVLGYVDNVHELMATASVLISKAGGLTTTEALSCGVPMLIYRPIPGQEDANANFLVRQGAGLLAEDEDQVSEWLTHLLTHPWELRAMARQSRQLGHPRAADRIAEETLRVVYGQEAHGSL